MLFSLYFMIFHARHLLQSQSRVFQGESVFCGKFLVDQHVSLSWQGQDLLSHSGKKKCLIVFSFCYPILYIPQSLICHVHCSSSVFGSLRQARFLTFLRVFFLEFLNKSLKPTHPWHLFHLTFDSDLSSEFKLSASCWKYFFLLIHVRLVKENKESIFPVNMKIWKASNPTF